MVSLCLYGVAEAYVSMRTVSLYLYGAELTKWRLSARQKFRRVNDDATIYKLKQSYSNLSINRGGSATPLMSRRLGDFSSCSSRRSLSSHLVSSIGRADVVAIRFLTSSRVGSSPQQRLNSWLIFTSFCLTTETRKSASGNFSSKFSQNHVRAIWCWRVLSSHPNLT